MKTIRLIILLALLAMSVARAAEPTLAELAAALGDADPAKRDAALVSLRAMPADTVIKGFLKMEAEIPMPPEQLLLINRAIGEQVLRSNTLKPLDLSKLTPLGEDKEHNIKGDPNIMIDRANKIISLSGEFVLETGPLEMLICEKHENAKLHETVAGVYAKPSDVCMALLACGFTFAGEVAEDGSVNLPAGAGVRISMEYEWERPSSKIKLPPENKNLIPATPVKKEGVEYVALRVPVEFLAWNQQTAKPMRAAPFAFTGSKYEKDPDTKKPVFMADIEKTIVAVKSDGYALLNSILNTRNIDPQHAAGYEVNKFIVPDRGTKCRVIFEAYGGGEIKATDLTDTAEKKPDDPAK